MSNLYAFGCSFSQYTWPMWPDILSQSFDNTKNYGHPGCGNFHIFHQALHCLLNEPISKNDTVIIQWTEPNRTDYIENSDWTNAGGYSAELLIKSKLDFIIADETALIKTLTYMQSLIYILKKIGCKWYFIFMSSECMVHKFDISTLDISDNVKSRYKNLQKYVNSYKDSLIDTISMTDFFCKINMPIVKCEWKVNNKLKKFEDDHPLPKFTFQYIKDIINPVLKLDLKKSDIFVKEVSLLFDDYNVINTENISKKINQMYNTAKFKKAIDGRSYD